MKIRIHFEATAHFDLEMDVEQETYDKLKRCGGAVWQSTDPDLHEMLIEAVNTDNIECYDHIIHDTDIEEVEIETILE